MMGKVFALGFVAAVTTVVVMDMEENKPTQPIQIGPSLTPVTITTTPKGYPNPDPPDSPGWQTFPTTATGTPGMICPKNSPKPLNTCDFGDWGGQNNTPQT